MSGRVIRICLQCKMVDELPRSLSTCPECNSVGSLGYWETPQMFQKYIKLNQPKDLHAKEEHIQYLIDEGLGVI